MGSDVSPSVAANVVTYNRRELLIECLNALMGQTYPLTAIYIIDNASTDGTLDLLIQKGFVDECDDRGEKVRHLPAPAFAGREIEIRYVRLDRNTGSSGGQHEGARRAYEAGHEWIWLMDDDAEPEKSSLEKLAVHFNQGGVAALANSVYLPNGMLCGDHRGRIDYRKVLPFMQTAVPREEYSSNCVDIDSASFVGILINRRAVASIGLPLKELFLHHDDIEYCIRLKRYGKIILVPDSVIIHKEASTHNLTLSSRGRRKRFAYNKLWLTYYGKRNILWLGRKHAKNRVRFYCAILKKFSRSIIGILLFDDNKLKRCQFVLCSYIDGLTGVFDNEKPKRILYRRELPK